MTEKQTFPPQESIQPEHDAFDDNLAIQQGLERSAAERILQTPPQNQSEATAWDMHDAKPVSPNRQKFVRAGVGAALTVAAAAGVVGAAHEGLSAPEFSEETTTYTVQPGDGLYDAAEQVEGIGAVDTRDVIDHIEADPANIDVLKDGLQPGESIVIPVEVKK